MLARLRSIGHGRYWGTQEIGIDFSLVNIPSAFDAPFTWNLYLRMAACSAPETVSPLASTNTVGREYLDKALKMKNL